MKMEHKECRAHTSTAAVAAIAIAGFLCIVFSARDDTVADERMTQADTLAYTQIYTQAMATSRTQTIAQTIAQSVAQTTAQTMAQADEARDKGELE
jgi:hypothetical protein